MKLRPSSDGTSVFVTRAGWAALATRPNPGGRMGADLSYLRSVARASCQQVPPTRQHERDKARETIAAARAERDAKTARVQGQCRGARAEVRQAKGIKKPRVTAGERRAEGIAVRDAEMRAELTDAGDWATWQATGGGKRWTGPRWRERFFEHLHDEGQNKWTNIREVSSDEYAAEEAAYLAELKRRKGERRANPSTKPDRFVWWEWDASHGVWYAWHRINPWSEALARMATVGRVFDNATEYAAQAWVEKGWSTSRSFTGKNRSATLKKAQGWVERSWRR